MKYFVFYFISIYFSVFAYADILMVPDSCLQKNKYPCLVKISNAASVEGYFKKVQFDSPSDAVFKVTSNNEKQFNVDILEGKIHFLIKDNRLHSQVNSMRFDAKEIFVERQGLQLTGFEIKTFTQIRWSAAALLEGSKGADDKIEISRNFLNKKDMISYLVPYFQSKKKLVVFLKNIEPKWKIEFEAETAKQTKVLERSIASVEEEQQKKIELKQKEHNERKKVRETFFQRTFYR